MRVKYCLDKLNCSKHIQAVNLVINDLLLHHLGDSAFQFLLRTSAQTEDPKVAFLAWLGRTNTAWTTLGLKTSSRTRKTRASC